MSATYPGQSRGLPADGPGSLAGWGRRIAAIVMDWAASMGLAVGIFGTEVVTGHDWRSWMILAIFFVQKALLTTLMGGSFGQLLARVGVVRTDGTPIAWWQALVRTALICLALPALIVGAERRAMPDLVLETVVVNRV